MANRIERTEYLNWLLESRDKQIIKVVSGVRRCGKSTLFEIYKDYLMGHDVDCSQIIHINLEDIEYEELLDYHALYNHIVKQLIADRMNYIFLDEIQHVEHFERVVDSLFLKENCDVYITGSNAYFLSGELATLLSGRYIELKILPLSFKEFCSALDENETLSNAERFNRYLERGSFPYLLKYKSSKSEAHQYLRDIYNSVLLKDIVARLKVADVTALENLVKYMFHNIGNITSPTKIANTLKSAGKGADQKTIDRYLRGLTDSLMLYEVPRYNLKGRMFLRTNSKYYLVDIGLRNMLIKSSESAIGHVLENIVYLELRRRGYDVYVGSLEAGEIDFVAIKEGETIYYQVAATTLDEQTLKRELTPFGRLRDNYPKYLLTLDEVFGSADYNGIHKRNVLEWLIDNEG